jgi:O-acetyl-ADP-ribose deacetylase (regulator of RNase III)
METIHGDLTKLALAGRFDVIIHGCNCQCIMGAGIAKTIKALFPEAYKADCQTAKSSRDKLGTFFSAAIVRPGANFTVVNAYTQYDWRGQGVKADYIAIQSVMKEVKNQFHGLRIGYPMIGAGLAGGDWNIISSIIDNELEEQNHTLVIYEP